jgi:hypothetical protein
MNRFMCYHGKMVTPIGPHLVETEGDVILVRLHGSFTLEHMKHWCQLADQVIAEHGQLFTISDFTAGGDFPPDSRRYATNHWQNTVYVRGTAMFGAGLVATVLISMMQRATALLRKHSIPMVSLKTEAEARAWVQEQRKLLPAK